MSNNPNPAEALDRLHDLIGRLTAAIRESRTDDERMRAAHMVYDVQVAACDYAQARADRIRDIYAPIPPAKGKIPVGPIVDHPNTNGEAKLLADMGVSRG